MVRSILRPIARFLFIWLATGLLGATASAQYSSRGQEARPVPPNIPANAKDIVLKGERVCLRRIPEPDGRVLLDCAIGLRGDDDQFYGLRAADPSRINAFPEMNVRVRVTGKLIPHGGGRFEEAGQIIYVAIEPIDGEPKPVTGIITCLAPYAANATAAVKCRNVIKTDRALYWGLDVTSLNALPAARGLTAGDRVALEADIVRDVPDDWRAWTFDSPGESIEGVLKVRTLKRVAR